MFVLLLHILRNKTQMANLEKYLEDRTSPNQFLRMEIPMFRLNEIGNPYF